LGFVISRLSPELLLRKLIDNLDVGAIFGLSVGLCLISRVLTHPILRLFLFILASTAAYLVSIFAALRALPFFHSSKQSIEFPLPIFLVAGFVGAFILLFAALVLFHRGAVKPKSLAKVFAWSVVGGVLGVLGWAVGPGHQDNSRFFALYFVWQTGMAACIGFMLSKESAATEASAEQSPTHEIERHLFGSALHVISAIFFLGVLCFLGWQYSRVVRGHLAFKQRQQAYRTYVAEAPSAENLPSISSLQMNEALLVQNIRGYIAGSPTMRSFPGSPTSAKGAVPIPPFVSYWILYTLYDESSSLPRMPPVMVTVMQYPNQEWAHFRAARFNPAITDPKYVTTETRFGNRVVVDRSVLGSLHLVWSSGTFVVTMQYESPEREGELLRRYLEKYPSSL
jgi:hypothetical protein